LTDRGSKPNRSINRNPQGIAVLDKFMISINVGVRI